MMRAERRTVPFLEAMARGAWEEAVAFLETVPREERSAPRLQLLEARAYQKIGRWGSAQRAAARVVEASATHSSWERGQPRMLAVALGSAAALELGDGKKAPSSERAESSREQQRAAESSREQQRAAESSRD